MSCGWSVQPGGAGRHPALADRHASVADGQLRKLPLTCSSRCRRPSAATACPALLFGSWPKDRTARCTSARAPRGRPAAVHAATGRHVRPGERRHRLRYTDDPRASADAAAQYPDRTRWRSSANSIELSLAATTAARAARCRYSSPAAGAASGTSTFTASSRGNQGLRADGDRGGMAVPCTRDYGITWPRVYVQASIRLAAGVALQADHLPGQCGLLRDGYMRALRNLNPRWDPATSRCRPYRARRAHLDRAPVDQRHCTRGQRLQLAEQWSPTTCRRRWSGSGQ